jgi:hypothetical protein
MMPQPATHDHDGSGGAVGRFERLLADIEADQELSDLEQGGRQQRTRPDVAPADLGIRQPFEHHGEQERDHGKGGDHYGDVQDGFRQIGCYELPRAGT